MFKGRAALIPPLLAREVSAQLTEGVCILVLKPALLLESDLPPPTRAGARPTSPMNGGGSFAR